MSGGSDQRRGGEGSGSKNEGSGNDRSSQSSSNQQQALQTPQSSSRSSSGGSGSGSNKRTSSGSSKRNSSSNSMYEDAFKKMMKLVNSLLQRQDCVPFREPVDWRGLELYDYPKIIKKLMDLGTVKRKLDRGQYKTPHDCAVDIRLIWTNCMKYNADGSDFWLLAKSLSRRFEDRYRRVKSEFDVGEVPLVPESSTSKGSGGGGNTDTAASSQDGHKSSSDNGNNKGTEQQQQYTTNPALDAKAKFGANMFLLSGTELAHVIMKLEVECPQALEQPTLAIPSGVGFNICPTSNQHNQDIATPQKQKMMYVEHSEQRMEINIDVIDYKLFQELNKYVNDKVGNKHVSCNNVEVDEVQLSRTKRRKK